MTAVVSNVSLLLAFGSLLLVGLFAFWLLVALKSRGVDGIVWVHGVAGFFLPVALGFIASAGGGFEDMAPMLAAFVVLGFALCVVFGTLMKAPTDYGRKLMDEIEGFKLYLSVAEKGRLNFHHAPERTPELFENHLPYAVALGVENKWGEQFDDILQTAATERGEDYYHPVWYRGGRRSYRYGGHFSTGAMVGAMASSVTSSIASAATPPSSSGSSGFGGGGSSGGGGGGGGGGGW